MFHFSLKVASLPPALPPKQSSQAAEAREKKFKIDTMFK